MTKLTQPKDVPTYALIIRATHERGDTQHAAVYELNRRGGWLTDDQKAQAGLTPEAYCVMCYTPPKGVHFREKHITEVLKRYNTKRGLTYPMIGYVYWADIKGNGGYSPSLYQIINAAGGVSAAYELIGATRRETAEKIAAACA